VKQINSKREKIEKYLFIEWMTRDSSNGPILSDVLEPWTISGACTIEGQLNTGFARNCTSFKILERNFDK
jgi:hypothetical protein